MTTTSYELRAMKFARFLVTLFDGCCELEDFIFAVKWYNARHSRKLVYSHGVSRFAIIRADYVIKFNMIPEGSFRDGRAGDNGTEEDVYAMAVADGMEYLLAKTTVVRIEDREIAIMPKINRVNDYSRDWHDYCTEEESDWLDEHINDLHDGNVGYKNGKVCVIDYAWDANA